MKKKYTTLSFPKTGTLNPRIIIPKEFTDEIGISTDNNQVLVSLNSEEKKILISMPEVRRDIREDKLNTLERKMVTESDVLKLGIEEAISKTNTVIKGKGKIIFFDELEYEIDLCFFIKNRQFLGRFFHDNYSIKHYLDNNKKDNFNLMKNAKLKDVKLTFVLQDFPFPNKLEIYSQEINEIFLKNLKYDNMIPQGEVEINIVFKTSIIFEIKDKGYFKKFYENNDFVGYAFKNYPSELEKDFLLDEKKKIRVIVQSNYIQLSYDKNLDKKEALKRIEAFKIAYGILYGEELLGRFYFNNEKIRIDFSQVKQTTGNRLVNIEKIEDSSINMQKICDYLYSNQIEVNKWKNISRFSNDISLNIDSSIVNKMTILEQFLSDTTKKSRDRELKDKLCLNHEKEGKLIRLVRNKIIHEGMPLKNAIQKTLSSMNKDKNEFEILKSGNKYLNTSNNDDHIGLIFYFELEKLINKMIINKFNLKGDVYSIDKYIKQEDIENIFKKEISLNLLEVI